VLLRQSAAPFRVSVRDWGPRHDLCWDEVDFVSGKINLLQKGDRQHIVWITTRLAELLRRQEGNRPECVLLMSARHCCPVNCRTQAG
jgi:integrase